MPTYYGDPCLRADVQSLLSGRRCAARHGALHPSRGTDHYRNMRAPHRVDSYRIRRESVPAATVHGVPTVLGGNIDSDACGIMVSILKLS